MDEQMLRKVLGEMLTPIQERLDRIDTRLSDVEKQANDLNDNLRLLIRQTGADSGEIRIELVKIGESLSDSGDLAEFKAETNQKLDEIQTELRYIGGIEGQQLRHEKRLNDHTSRLAKIEEELRIAKQ